MITGIWADIVSAFGRDLVFFCLEMFKRGRLSENGLIIIKKTAREGVSNDELIHRAQEYLRHSDFTRFMRIYSPEERKHPFTMNTTIAMGVMEALMMPTINPDDKLAEPRKMAELFKITLGPWEKAYRHASYFGLTAAAGVAPIGYLSRGSSYLLTGRSAMQVLKVDPETVRSGLAIIDTVAMASRENRRQEIREKIEYEYFYNLDRALLQADKSLVFSQDSDKVAKGAILTFLEDASDPEGSAKEATRNGTHPMITALLCDAFTGYDSRKTAVTKLLEISLDQKMLDILSKFAEKNMVRQ